MAAIGIPGLAPELEVELKAGMQKVEALLLSHIQGNYPLVEETSRQIGRAHV